MKTLKQLERLRKAHKLIKLGKTGKPSDFANKLHISQRELYRVLEYLRELDSIIVYSRRSSSYHYEGDFDLMVNVSIKVNINQQVRTIYSGPTFIGE